MSNMSMLWIIGLYAFLSYWMVVLILERKGVLARYNISSFGPILIIRTKRGQKLLDVLASGDFRRKFWRFYGNIGAFLIVITMVTMFSLLIIIFLRIFLAPAPQMPSEYSKPQNILLIPGLNEFIPLCGWIGLIVAVVAHEISHAVLCRVEGIRVKSMGLLLAMIPIGGFAEPDSEQLFGKKESRKQDSNASTGANASADAADKNASTGANAGANAKEEKGNRGSKETGETSERDSEGSRREGERKKVATPFERTRILAAGITSNFCIAIFSFLLFLAFLHTIQPVSEFAPYVYGVAPGSPAEKAGLKEGMLIIAVDGNPVKSVDDLKVRKSEANLTVLYANGSVRDIFVSNICEGVYILDVIENYPAQRAGISGGMCIVSIDNITNPSFEEFISFMNSTHPGQTLYLRVRTPDGNETEYFVNLTFAPHGEKKGFLGVIVANIPLGIAVGFPSQDYLENLRHRFQSIFMPKSVEEWFYAWPEICALPFYPPPIGFNSFNPMLSRFYTLSSGFLSLFSGISGILPVSESELRGACFFIADVLFWTAWINLQVALFNCLPAIPLDGGHVFREVARTALFFIKDERMRERVSMAIAGVLSVSIFSLLILTILRSFLIAAH